MKKIFVLLGRICMSLIFISSAINKILNWDMSQNFLVGHICDWLNQTYLPSVVHDGLNMVVTKASLALGIAVIFELLGGLLVLLGLRVQFGATLLILFLIPATLLMHAFWMYDGSMYELQMVNFMKNFAILGGLFILAASSGGE